MSSLIKNYVIALILSLSAIFIMVLPTLSAQAAVPTEASLMRLIEVTKVLEALNEMPNNRFNDKSNDNPALDLASQETLIPLPETDDSKDSEDFNQLIVNAYVESAKQHYSQKEVDAMITFYSSEVGQSILSKQSIVMQSYMEIIRRSVAELMINSME